MLDGQLCKRSLREDDALKLARTSSEESMARVSTARECRVSKSSNADDRGPLLFHVATFQRLKKRRETSSCNSGLWKDLAAEHSLRVSTSNHRTRTRVIMSGRPVANSWRGYRKLPVAVPLLVCGDRLRIAMPRMENESQIGINFAAKTCPWGTLAFATAMETIRRTAMSSARQAYDLKWLLWQLHRSLGGAIHPKDEKSWQLAASAFEEDASTVVKYQSYGPKHAMFFKTNGVELEKAIDPRMWTLISESFRRGGTREDVKKQLMGSGLIQEIVPELVYSFPIFTLDFCALLMEEIRHFYGSKLPARRPNSMNNYGIILNEIGLEPMIFDLQDAVIQPLASVLFPLEGSELESHHSFTIRYKGGEDTHLDVHTDDSDVTFNVNIFGNYTGAPLVFCGINGEPDHRHFRTAYQHQLGYAVMHRGRHRHGAEDITGGERMNLVVWSYSYNYRHSKESVKVHLKEASKPDERCVSYTHDRDFGRYKAWPPGKKERFMGRGWCPPRGKEYAYQKVGIHDDSWVCQMDSFLMCLTTSCLTDPKEEDNRNNDVKRCG
eukprot:s4231_g2.t2